MNQVKMGVVLIALSVMLGVVFFLVLSQLKDEQMELGCIPQRERCLEIESNLSVTHVGVGIIAATLALGLYLMLFSGGEQAILRRLEEEKNKKLSEEKFAILLRAFDGNEQAVLKALREQPGIEQNTLRLKTGLSKAKISQILTGLEKKRLIRREAKNRTFSVWLSEDF